MPRSLILLLCLFLSIPQSTKAAYLVRADNLDDWLKTVATLPAEKQLEAVAAKLKELNPGFDGKLISKIEGGKVTELEVSSNEISDVSAVRALTGLTQLNCRGSAADKGKLSDLSPLKDLPLRSLNISATKAIDLSPLKGMRLTTLDCSKTSVADLSPLKGMPLISLHCQGCKVTDFSPLQGMPLKELTCDFDGKRDANLLRSLKTLEKINGKPAAEFWKTFDSGMK